MIVMIKKEETANNSLAALTRRQGPTRSSMVALRDVGLPINY
jgi:hypothetical protein